ncbi:MAG: hypothetical protein QOF62_332 [Pyrinomonadaceae bacterium]|jgi:hypothetical protein|nr:hypothetical protein [Pyrinomonadaceae bacterium]
MDDSTAKMDATASRKVARVGITVNPQGQKLDAINKMVALALGRAGCEACGRIAYLDFHFLGDPGPDLSRVGGISLDVQMR